MYFQQPNSKTVKLILFDNIINRAAYCEQKATSILQWRQLQVIENQLEYPEMNTEQVKAFFAGLVKGNRLHWLPRPSLYNK